MQYQEIQSNEVEALKAIYMDDFESLPHTSAWERQPAPKFRIKLRPSSEFAESNIWLDITVTMTSTYPRTLPTIVVGQSNAIHPKQLESIRKSIADTIKDLLGSEMIFEVTSNIQLLLDEFARFSQETPSLEQERLDRLKLAKEQQKHQQEQLRKEQEARMQQQEKDLENLVLAELDQRDTTKNSGAAVVEASASLVPETEDILTLDRPVRARKSNGALISFQQVRKGFPVNLNFFGTSQFAKPIVPSQVDAGDLQFVFTSIALTEPFWDTITGRKQLNNLERELETVKEFRHQNVMALYDFRISKSEHSKSWEIWLLTQYCTMGTLSDLLDVVINVEVKVARSWAIQILEGLEALHKSGLVHKSLYLENALFNKNKDTGETSIVLAYPSFLFRLVEMNNLHPFSSSVTSSQLERRWQSPEFQAVKAINPTRKSDIWDFGVMLVRMLSGSSAMNDFNDPASFVRSQKWPQTLTSFLLSIFDRSAKNRPSAFELLMWQFLRSNDDMALVSARASSFSRPRANSEIDRSVGVYSRYINDFDEAVMLGKGGFGQVVKARNKLDGRVYAVKKIQATSATLSFILQEVVLLSRLNHSNVVRYYTAWLEEDRLPLSVASVDESLNESAESSRVDMSVESSGDSTPKFTVSMSDLDLFGSSRDLMSGSQYSFVQFANSDDDGDDGAIESESDESDSAESEDDSIPSVLTATLAARGRKSHGHSKSSRALNLQRLARVPKPALKSTLYIQMEYCENHTLADLIRDGLYKQPAEYWRLMRQIVEALAYIHQDGVIHRDLKPKNIFIDEARNIKIGDFGLARSVVQNTNLNALTSTGALASADGDDLTTGLGTSLYVAVEITGEGKGNYNEKVDIYSLGIIFFEMVSSTRTEMERVATIRRLRHPSIEIPPELSVKKHQQEREILNALLCHDPAKRPTAAQLLKSGMIPAGTEDLTIKDALNTLVGAKSKSILQVCDALFSQPLISAQQVLYGREKSGARGQFKPSTASTISQALLRNEVEERLRAVFQLHGAVEDSTFRSRIFPKSAMYKTNTVVELLDPTGNVLQLPHDLTLPYARRLAEHIPEYSKSYTFSPSFRSDPANPGQHPHVISEVDFDIVGPESAVDPLYHDAETIKVMVEAASVFPVPASGSLCVYVNHSDILLTILDYAGFTQPQHYAALSLLGETGVGPAKHTLRRELLASSTLSATSLDTLEQMGFREPIASAETRLCRLLDDNNDGIKRATVYLQAVSELAKKYGVNVPIYFAPLSNFQPKFYESGIMFQLVYENGPKRRILATGGRYDRLIRGFRHSVLDRDTPIARAVGFSMAIDRFVEHIGSMPKSKLTDLSYARPRCQVLVASFSESNIQGLCMDILRLLWKNGIAADLVRRVVSTDEILAQAETENVPFVVVVKQLHSLTMSTRSFKPIKLRRLSDKAEFDMSTEELLPFLLGEISTGPRSRRSAVTADAVAAGSEPLLESPNLSNITGVPGQSDEPNKTIVMNMIGKVKGGRKNLWLLEEKSREASHQFLAELAAAPVVALDLRDDVIQAITAVSPHSPDEWKRRVVGLSPSQKGYIMSVQARLSTEAARSSRLMLYSIKTENVFVYNIESL